MKLTPYAITKLAITGLLLMTTAAQADQRYTTIAEGLHFPWSVAQLPDTGWLVTERSGQLVYVAPDGQKSTVAMQLDGLFVDAQAGLFEVLLSTDFSTSRELFLSYACGTANANATCISRAQLSPQPPYQLQQAKQIFRASPDKKGSAHYGARMTWWADGTLLLSLGDGFDYREQAQNLNSDLGKVIRINRDGSIPADNPYTHTESPAIFSYGHRNVQGLVYDAQRDIIWQHEHGPKGGDEINILEKGRNYGWPMVTYGIDYTGAKVSPFQELPGIDIPLWVWTPSLAPAGLAVYYGDKHPDWQGDLLVSHLAGKRLQRFRYRNGILELEQQLLDDLGLRFRAVHVGHDSHVYVLTDSPEGVLIQLN